MRSLVNVDWVGGKKIKYNDGRDRHGHGHWTGRHPLVGILLAIADAGNMVDESENRGCIPGGAAELMSDNMSQMWYTVQHWISDWTGALGHDVEDFAGPTEPSACPICMEPADTGSTSCYENHLHCKKCNLCFYTPMGEGL